MKPSHPIGRSTSHDNLITRHLNAFRGVRAISEFDWPFTPTHTSSRSFSTLLLVRASMECYLHFTLDMCRSLGFASTPTNYTPSSGSLSLRITRLKRLTSLVMVTRRFIMQKARRHRIYRLRPLVGAWFQVLFHSPHRGAFHRSLTVLSTIGLTGVFSLTGWSRLPLSYFSLRIRNYHPLWLNFPEHSSHNQYTIAWSYYPRDASLQPWFGLFPVRSPLLGESFIYFLFLEVLRCFSSLGSPP